MPNKLNGAVVPNAFIRKRVTQQIFNAFDFARSKGNSLNYYVVIHLQDTHAQASTTSLQRILHKYRDWLAYLRKRGNKSVIPCYVYTQENPAGDNPHVNWCLYIPDELHGEFEEKIKEWVERVQGPVEPNTIDCKKIDQTRYKSLANYILKGTDPDHTDRFHLRDVHDRKGPQGPIFGRRAGVSHSLGPRAIRGAGFNPTSFRRIVANNR